MIYNYFLYKLPTEESGFRIRGRHHQDKLFLRLLPHPVRLYACIIYRIILCQINSDHVHLRGLDLLNSIHYIFVQLVFQQLRFEHFLYLLLQKRPFGCYLQSFEFLNLHECGLKCMMFINFNLISYNFQLTIDNFRFFVIKIIHSFRFHYLILDTQIFLNLVQNKIEIT